MVNSKVKETTDIQDENNVDLFFNIIRGIIHSEFVTKETTVNQTIYVEALKKLIDAVRRKRGELQRDHSLTFLHDNMLTHSSLQVLQFLA
jgi:hypothetical protein